jgi:hypothetical protein
VAPEAVASLWVLKLVVKKGVKLVVLRVAMRAVLSAALKAANWDDRMAALLVEMMVCRWVWKSAVQSAGWTVSNWAAHSDALMVDWKVVDWGVRWANSMVLWSAVLKPAWKVDSMVFAWERCKVDRLVDWKDSTTKHAPQKAVQMVVLLVCMSVVCLADLLASQLVVRWELQMASIQDILKASQLLIRLDG